MRNYPFMRAVILLFVGFCIGVLLFNEVIPWFQGLFQPLIDSLSKF